METAYLISTDQQSHRYPLYPALAKVNHAIGAVLATATLADETLEEVCALQALEPWAGSETLLSFSNGAPFAIKDALAATGCSAARAHPEKAPAPISAIRACPILECPCPFLIFTGGDLPFDSTVDRAHQTWSDRYRRRASAPDESPPPETERRRP